MGDDFDDEFCFNCDGDGFVYGCSWDWQCDTWDGDSCLCSRPCYVCNPKKPDPELQKALAQAMTPHTNGEENDGSKANG